MRSLSSMSSDIFCRAHEKAHRECRRSAENFDLTHKITRRKEAEVKLKSLKTFIPDLDVPTATQKYLALITSLGNSPDHSSIISKLQFANRTGGYENIIPVL